MKLSPIEQRRADGSLRWVWEKDDHGTVRVMTTYLAGAEYPSSTILYRADGTRQERIGYRPDGTECERTTYDLAECEEVTVHFDTKEQPTHKTWPQRPLLGVLPLSGCREESS